MTYRIVFKPRAIKDLKTIPQKTAHQIIRRVEALKNNLEGDVKRLTNFTPEYRLRIGQYRVLFEIEEETIVIYRIRHRKDAYS